MAVKCHRCGDDADFVWSGGPDQIVSRFYCMECFAIDNPEQVSVVEQGITRAISNILHKASLDS